MTISVNLKRKGFARIEVIVVILIVLIGFFLAIPLVNTFFKSHPINSVIHEDQDLKIWNAGMEKNQSNNPAQILEDK
jgi:competence protein ComGC